MMTTQPSDTIELGQVVRTVVRGWRAVVGFTLFGLVAAAAIIEFAPPKYTGMTTVVLKSGGSSTGGTSILSQVSGLGDLTAGLLGGKSSIETEIEVMSSRAVVGDVVDSLLLQAKVTGPAAIATGQVISNLSASGSFKTRKYRFERAGEGASYRFSGKGESGQMVPGTPTRLSVGTITFAPAAALPGKFGLTLRDRADAVVWVSKHLKVDKEKGDVASITYHGDDSVTAARVPNTVLSMYLSRRRTTDRGINQRRLEFLMAKSDSMDRALTAAGAALRRQQEASGMLDPKAVAKVDLERRSLVQSKLTDVLVEQGALRQLMDQITAKTANPRDLAAYPRWSNGIINNLVSQLADLDTRRTLLLAERSPTDREVVALDKSAADVEAKLVPYARTYAAALERERIDLDASLDRVDKALAALPKAAESSEQLEADVTGMTKLAAGLQGQIVEAKLAAIGEGGDVRPLDAAIEPKKPSFPDPLITLAVGLFGGLFFGFVAALVIGSVGRWMRDPLEVERTTGVPAMQFDPAVPLLLSNGTSRTIVVAPIVAGASVTAVVNRLAQTAASRSLSSAVLELPAVATDVNGSIARLEAEHDLVIVQLPSLESDTAAAALQHTRPVLLVAPGRRIERRRLIGAVQMLKRLEVPVAGIVMSNGAGDGHALTR